MRKLRRFCASLSLAIALSTPTVAGNIHFDYVPPPPPPSPMVYEPTDDATSVDPLAELALALLNGVLSVF